MKTSERLLKTFLYVVFIGGCILAVVAILNMSDDCEAKGGVLARTLAGGLECVKPLD